jgi:NAD(P)-dependent dehydrogenase (short-subunit alcohol dehydrogenase family)
MWDKIAADFGSVDALINNAGISIASSRTHEMSVEDWDRLMAVNMRGVFLNTKHALALMLQNGGGSIVNIASIAGLRGYYPDGPGLVSNYAASKAGVIGFTRQVAAEYARDKIRVNAIAPGWHGGTQLGRERRARAEQGAIRRFNEFIESSIPMGHMGAPEDLTGLAIYLASSASRYVTGQIFAHDGGLTAA